MTVEMMKKNFNKKLLNFGFCKTIIHQKCFRKIDFYDCITKNYQSQ